MRLCRSGPTPHLGLIEHGANTAAQDEQWWTPLHHASAGGHADLAGILIEHGADAAAQDGDGLTPLDWASERGHVDLARLLTEHGPTTAQPTFCSPN